MTWRPHPAALVAVVAVGVLAVSGYGALAPLRDLAAATAEPPAAAALSDAPSSTPVAQATDAGPAPYARNDTVYDIAALPLIDVRSVNPAVPVDDDPMGPVTSSLARPLGAGAPVFADPTGQPVGHLPRDHHYGGTTVPVVEAQTDWVKVLLPGRQGVPPEGNGGQTVGWLRVADLELTTTPQYVEVHLAANTIDIVSAAGRERVSDQFAWGKPSTPTPTGRTFVMWTTVVPEFRYTQGHPMVYLGVQSPVMAGFDGGDVAVTAFHYYRMREGDTSFGCIYLDGPAVDRLAELPAGTPVLIQP
jgi:hypothetical protein